MTANDELEIALDKLRATIDAVPDITKLRAAHAQLLAAARQALLFLAGGDSEQPTETNVHFFFSRSGSPDSIIARLQSAIAKAEELAP